MFYRCLPVVVFFFSNWGGGGGGETGIGAITQKMFLPSLTVSIVFTFLNAWELYLKKKWVLLFHP